MPSHMFSEEVVDDFRIKFDDEDVEKSGHITSEAVGQVSINF